MKTAPAHLHLGKLGEELASRFLEEKGYKIVDRNYRKKGGEIDIVCQKRQIIHFVEVKSVSCESLAAVSADFRPEDNVHSWKEKRLRLAINLYLLEKNLSEIDWQFNVVTVQISESEKAAKIKFLKDIIL